MPPIFEILFKHSQPFIQGDTPLPEWRAFFNCCGLTSFFISWQRRNLIRYKPGQRYQENITKITSSSDLGSFKSGPDSNIVMDDVVNNPHTSQRLQDYDSPFENWLDNPRGAPSIPSKGKGKLWELKSESPQSLDSPPSDSEDSDYKQLTKEEEGTSQKVHRQCEVRTLSAWGGK